MESEKWKIINKFFNFPFVQLFCICGLPRGSLVMTAHLRVLRTVIARNESDEAIHKSFTDSLSFQYN